jgi:hypothetical protein
MPAKTGGSHAVASLVSIVLASVMSGYVNAHAGSITETTGKIALAAANTVGLSLPADVAGILVFVVALSFLWGTAYHYARHGRGSA